jgi:hypothetical protein
MTRYASIVSRVLQAAPKADIDKRFAPAEDLFRPASGSDEKPWGDATWLRPAVPKLSTYLDALARCKRRWVWSSPSSDLRSEGDLGLGVQQEMDLAGQPIE